MSVRGGYCAVQRRAHLPLRQPAQRPGALGRLRLVPDPALLDHHPLRPAVRPGAVLRPGRRLYLTPRTCPAAAITGADLARWGGAGNMRQGIDALVGSPVPASFRMGQRQSAITLEARREPRLRAGAHLLGDALPGRHLDGPQPGRHPRREPAVRGAGGHAQQSGWPGTWTSLRPRAATASSGSRTSASRSPRRATAGGWTSSAGSLPRSGSTSRSPGIPGPYVPSAFNWRFPDLIFLLTIQNFGTFGAS